MADITIPSDLWEDDKEGVLLTWIYSDGAIVEEGKLLAEIVVEKAQLELLAPERGRLRILVQPDEVIRKGQVIGRLEPV